MKIAHSTLSIIFCVFLVSLTACKGGEATSNTSAKATPPPPPSATAPANSNQPAAVPDSNRNAAAKSPANSETPKPKGPTGLVGTYESTEVQKEGVVTVMSKLKTVWLFQADGNYSRVSAVNGKPYHGDSGNFKLEPPDKLVLTILMTGLKQSRKVQNPPLTKTHKYSLSPDGEELRLISEKGSTGIFKRVAKPSAP